VRVSVGAGPVRFHGLWALLGWAVCRVLVGAVRLAVCRPRSAVAVTVLSGLLWALWSHPVAAVLGVAIVVECGHAWSVLHRPSWRRTAGAWWRSVWVYRRRWARVMRVAKLVEVDEDGRRRLPRLGRVRCTDTTDVLQVRALLGQRFTDWEDAGPMIAHAFGATGVELQRGDDRRLTVELVRGERGRSWNREGRSLAADYDTA
jgi:hypothetical protein